MHLGGLGMTPIRCFAFLEPYEPQSQLFRQPFSLGDVIIAEMAHGPEGIDEPAMIPLDL
jgi:hypothetical protein